ncbi:hypothetical protein DW149_01785 [Bifidobacterium pseudocatenulatum]|nr:hypothetical protein DWV26_04370 [Bifidobacterium pseudocatenulatum]RHI81420.1 hypothetical protein DW154_03590 [Bifidobacterium pseudocatenulatum]RHI90636.1 hypothetical protein DW149_01785 [Bifidobacterium pseudocatenulatum]RHK79438.1 hypothetical protein DW045_04250 [Bifidobacterium pseudocatenulatum]
MLLHHIILTEQQRRSQIIKGTYGNKKAVHYNREGIPILLFIVAYSIVGKSWSSDIYLKILGKFFRRLKINQFNF